MKNFVSGPHTVSIHKLGEKTITIFGEHHELMTECKKAGDHPVMTIDDYIREYCTETEPEEVDLFMESVYVPSRSYGWFGRKMYWDISSAQTSKLTGLRKLFDACAPKWWLGWFKDVIYDCPKNMRVHLCDVRQMAGTDPSWSETQRKMVDIFIICFLLAFPHDLSLYGTTWDEIGNFFSVFLHDKKSPYYHTRMDKVLMRILKIDKQIDAIQNKRYRSVLRAFFAQKKKESIAVLKKIDPENEVLLLDSFFSYQLHFMDMYLMARVLRHFQDGTTPRNIIIYVGDHHADTYRKFLARLGARRLFIYPKALQIILKNRNYKLLDDIQTCVRI